MTLLTKLGLGLLVFKNAHSHIEGICHFYDRLVNCVSVTSSIQVATFAASPYFCPYSILFSVTGRFSSNLVFLFLHLLFLLSLSDTHASSHSDIFKWLLRRFKGITL